MDILLLAAETMVSQTLQRMLKSYKGWSIFRWYQPKIDKLTEYRSPDSLDGIVVNLPDFADFYISVIQIVRKQFPDLPLLALSNYGDDLLIEPLLAAGADGYLQLGCSDEDLRNALEKVLEGESCVITENT